MSTIAINPVNRVVRFYEAPIGKKVIMAFTGLILFGYVVAHLLGNLQIYLPAGADGEYQINHYAAFLHSPGNVGLLTAARLFLLVAVGMHIVASIQLWKLKGEARPVAYKKKDDASATYASRTMMWSGPIIALFVIFHILDLTTGTASTSRSFRMSVVSPSSGRRGVQAPSWSCASHAGHQGEGRTTTRSRVGVPRPPATTSRSITERVTARDAHRRNHVFVAVRFRGAPARRHQR